MTTTQHQMPTRRQWTIAALAAGLLAASAAAFLLWPRPSLLEQAHETCGIGELRGEALVIETDGLNERVQAYPGIWCLFEELVDPPRDWDDLTAAYGGTGLQQEQWGNVKMTGEHVGAHSVVTFSLID